VGVLAIEVAVEAMLLESDHFVGQAGKWDLLLYFEVEFDALKLLIKSGLTFKGPFLDHEGTLKNQRVF
jgi:hypothetical protein